MNTVGLLDLKIRVEELKCNLSPFEVLVSFKEEAYSFLLETSLTIGDLGRYSFVGTSPFATLQSKGDNVKIGQDDRIQMIKGSAFTQLERMIKTHHLPPPPNCPPFPGGGVGYFGYDLNRLLEDLPDKAADDLMLPDCSFMFVDAVVAFDHLEGKLYLLGSEEGVNQLRERLRTAANPPGANLKPKDYKFRLQETVTKETYVDNIRRSKEYIRAGDIYQVNLSQRFDLDFTRADGDMPYHIYRALRQESPSPFSAFLKFGELALISSSPERFLRLSGRRAQTRPIKGTRPRGKNQEEDDRLKSDLLESVKERAENLMIVDLSRNDLGRVCRYGSVAVPELFKVEKYRTLYQMVSTIVGELKEGMTAFDLLRASFPPGSMTGTPKLRAMEIIEELERYKRGIYSGALGYLGFSGDMDLSVVIRTLILNGDRGCFQVGGAVVADSDPEEEYNETLDKAEGIVRALRRLQVK